MQHDTNTTEEREVEYVAPAIENVMTPEDLEREVFYAGSSGNIIGPGPSQLA